MTDEYRAKAEHCRQMANQVLSPLDKETWLQLAGIGRRWRRCGSTHQERAPQLAEPLMPGLH